MKVNYINIIHMEKIFDNLVTCGSGANKLGMLVGKTSVI